VIFNGDTVPSEQFTVRDSEAGLRPIQVAGLWESRQQLIETRCMLVDEALVRALIFDDGCVQPVAHDRTGLASPTFNVVNLGLEGRYVSRRR